MLLCQNDRHRNPVSLIQYPEVVLVVGYIMLGTLAAFGLVSAVVCKVYKGNAETERG